MPKHARGTQSSRARTAAAVIDAPINIRCARTSDAGSIAPLFDAYRQFYGATSDVTAARRFLLERLAHNESVVFMAFLTADGTAPDDTRESTVAEVIGFTQLYPSFSSLALAPIIVLNDLYVAPAWRRAHVARRLIKEVVGYATRLRAARIALSTQHTNAPARQLYSSIGFTADDTFSHLSLTLPRAR